jgi:predicted aconitase
MQLSSFDEACLAGANGEATRFAMKLLVAVGKVTGAHSMLDVSQAHLVGCYDSGPANIQFLDAMIKQGAKVRVPTTLNASSACVSTNSPSAVKDICRARGVIDRYETMGCTATLTCAPYHLPSSPERGESVAWAESNAVAYANSVIGARTNKTPQYLDLCAAITGRIPRTGFYLDENRRAQLLIDCTGISARRWNSSLTYQLLGLEMGKNADSAVPVLVGLPDTTGDDDLRAIGAGGASAGNVAMFHAVGLTPEAPDLKSALDGRAPTGTVSIGDADLERLAEQFSAPPGASVSAVCLGTPHFSLEEFQGLLGELEKAQHHCVIPLYVTTSRHVKAQLEQRLLLAELLNRGVQVVTDSCSYYGPVVPGLEGVVMTNSSKWAYYASGNLGINACLARLADCVTTACTGNVPARGAE